VKVDRAIKRAPRDNAVAEIQMQKQKDYFDNVAKEKENKKKPKGMGD